MRATETSAAGAATPMLFREAMSRVASAVHVVTTVGPFGRAGMTASAVCAVTDQPPTLLLCLNASARAHRTLIGNARFQVSVLKGGDRETARAFSDPAVTMDARFADPRWRDDGTGALSFADALAAFQCSVSNVSRCGTHDVIYGLVTRVEVGREADPLVYFARRFLTTTP